MIRVSFDTWSAEDSTVKNFSPKTVLINFSSQRKHIQSGYLEFWARFIEILSKICTLSIDITTGSFFFKEQAREEIGRYLSIFSTDVNIEKALFKGIDV